MSDGARAAAQYDAMAGAYAADGETGPFNARYERPAMLALVGNVAGKRVLELGCGAGHLTEALVERGASVTAVDVSSKLVELARHRLGDRAEILLADLHDGLPFAADGSCDLVVASLVLHYLRDWVPILREVRRVLGRGGAFVLSTHHPGGGLEPLTDDYFALTEVTEVWEKGGSPFEVTFWHRPLTAMFDAFAQTGLLVDRLVEPQPDPALRDEDPTRFELLSTRPWFLFLRLVPEGQ